MNKIGAAVQVVFTLIGSLIIATVVYYSLSSPFNLIAAIAVLVLGLYLARFVYQLILQRGLLSAMTGDNASYELDNLQPSIGSGTYVLSASDFVGSFNDDSCNIPKAVSLAIWGDSLDRGLDQKHTIKNVELDENENILTIKFKGGSSCLVRNPGQVMFSPSFIKVLTAKEISWRTISVDEESNSYSYLDTGKNIATRSNTDWTPKQYQVGRGMDALYLQG